MIPYFQTISKAERYEKNLTTSNLTYGEIVRLTTIVINTSINQEFKAIAQVFHFIKRKFGVFSNPGSVFVDIGSGTGKGVLTGCLMHEFDRCIGVELLENLYKKSLEMQDVYDIHIEEQASQ